MKHFPPLAAALTLFVCFSIATAQNGSSNTVLELTNSDILTMVKASLPPELIISKINTSRCRFDTYPSVMAELKYRGVSDRILIAMVEAPVGRPQKPVEEPKSVESTDAVSGPKSKPATGGVTFQDRTEQPHNARFYVAPMEEGFDGLVSALMIEKKLPVSIVADENLADFIVVGATNKGTHKWYDTVFGSGYERDRNQGSIRVIRVKDKTVLWAAQKGDRSLWWGALKKGGKRKVAERLVNQMKDDLFKNRF